MFDPACKHVRTRVIAKDDDVQYVECLECGEILEAGELNDGTGLDGSLSDA
jgi:Zn ribbon nucleic-acid-binding protein